MWQGRAQTLAERGGSAPNSGGEDVGHLHQSLRARSSEIEPGPASKSLCFLPSHLEICHQSQESWHFFAFSQTSNGYWKPALLLVQVNFTSQWPDARHHFPTFDTDNIGRSAALEGMVLHMMKGEWISWNPESSSKASCRSKQAEAPAKKIYSILLANCVLYMLCCAVNPTFLLKSSPNKDSACSCLLSHA